MWLCWFCTKLDMMSIGTGNTIVLERRLRPLVTHSHSTLKQLKKSEYELLASVLPPPVVLRGDAVEGLQVAELEEMVGHCLVGDISHLESGRTVYDHLSCVL